MKTILLITSVLLLCAGCHQKTDQAYLNEISQWQNGMNSEFSVAESSPLTPGGLSEFHGLDFFPINEDFKVEAQFVATPDEDTFGMETTTDRRPTYKKYGEAHFTLEGQKFKLDIFQNQELLNHSEYQDYLFIPFKDKTNGITSYHGGRYIEASIPQNDTLVIDFNYAYNPYCAYNHNYSCPIPPAQNYLDIEIEAGVKDYHGKY